MTANKLANDNNRLRARLLEFAAPKEEEEQWREEKLVELEFLLGEYKTLCTALSKVEETGRAGTYKQRNFLISALCIKV
jgi:hypothetical protein